MTAKTFIAALTIVGVVSSCTRGAEPEDVLLPGSDDSEYTSVSMILPQIEILEDDPLTKMTVNVQSSPVAYLWSEKDTVGIFPDKGSQIYFSMADGVGTSKVSFDGGGWALKKNSSYYSYFPFVPDFYIRKDAIPINFEGQSQLGNADPNVADVGRYCYMAAAGDSDPGTGNLTFKYERLGVISRFQIPVDADTYTSLTIRPGSSVLAYKGTYNATEIDQTIHNASYSDELSLALEEVTFTEPAVLVAFMMLPPFDIKGKQLTVDLTKSDGTVVTSSAFGKNYALGTAQGSSMNFSVYGKNTFIDGKGGTAQVVITGSTTRSHSYTVSTDVDWLTLGSSPTSGSAVINVTAAKGTGTVRSGHVIVSEQVTSGGTAITLQNKVKITQDSTGMGVDQEPWEEGENVEDEI